MEEKSDLKGEEGNQGILKVLKRIQTSPHTIGGKLWLKETGGGVSPLKEALVPELEVRTGFRMWPLKSHLSQWLLAADNTGIVKAVKSAFHPEMLISFSLAMDYLFRMILGG